jgi:hypothetical protein
MIAFFLYLASVRRGTADYILLSVLWVHYVSLNRQETGVVWRVQNNTEILLNHALSVPRGARFAGILGRNTKTSLKDEEIVRV